MDKPVQAQHTDEYSTSFAAALLDPDRAAPHIMKKSKDYTTLKRYNIYRNNVTVSLINALAAIYPAVERLTGSDFFRAMARFHLRQTPPTSPLLFEYGRDFPDFIAQYAHAAPMPWLADVARIERAWLDAYHAADEVPFQVNILSAVPSESVANMIFFPHPATRLVGSTYAAATIFAENRRSEPVRLIDASHSEAALITRPDIQVEVRTLSPDAASFFSALIRGETLGAATCAALAQNQSFDLSAHLACLIESGAFTSFKFGEE
jgi:hypothetical protein